MARVKAVQFLGVAQRTDEKSGEALPFEFSDLQFSAHPKWLQDVMDAGRIHMEYDRGERVPVYRTPDHGHVYLVEPDAWLIDLGGGVLRVVDNTTFDAVTKAAG